VAKITGNLDMSSSGKIVNLVTPTNNQDAATKSYVDTATTNMATTSSVSTAITNALGSSGTQTNNPTCYITPAKNSLGTDGSYFVGVSANSFVNGVLRRELVAGTNSPYFRGNMIIAIGGMVAGSPTMEPQAPLHVFGSASNTITGTTRYWDNAGNTGNWGPTIAIALITENSIWNKGTYSWVTSDQRIKKNIVNLNADKMMNVFRTLRPISFDFIDPMKNMNKKHFGFIAQEVNEFLPEGITINTDVIPNNMMKGGITKPSETGEEPNFTLKPDDTDITLQYLLLTMDSPLKFDTANPYSSTDTYKFKVYCGEKWAKEQDIYIRSEYNVTDDKYTYVIGMKKDVYDVAITEPTLFVYGQYVYDLHILEHDTIYTVATAALQEVDRQQQADKARIAELEATVATQQSLINDILERLKALERT
jgi:hypothetical protein